MGSYIKSFKLYLSDLSFIKIALLLGVILLNFSLISCSHSVPEVTGAECSVVFSYNDYDSLPEAKLSVFAKSNADVRRCEVIKVYSTESQYLWETDNLRKIAQGDFQWAGNSNFIVPQYEKIPTGKYEITYVHSNEEQQVLYTDINYDKNIYEKKADEIPELMNDKGTMNIAVYDSSNVLLFLGEKTDDFSTSSDILGRYNNASYYKEVWITYDNGVICLMPAEKLETVAGEN